MVSIEQILKYYQLEAFLPEFEKNYITPQNIWFLKVEDWKAVGIPIGPAWQIANDF